MRLFSLRRAATLIAKNEIWLLWVYGAPLLISSSLPVWVLAPALATIPVFWIARRMVWGRWSVQTPLTLPILLLLSMGIVAVVVSLDLPTSAKMYAELLGGAAFYYGLVNGLTSPEMEKGRRIVAGTSWRFQAMLWVLVGLGLVMALVGFLGLRFSDKFLPLAIYPYLPKLDFSVFNPRGFTPNIVAGAIAPTVPLCWILGWTGSRGRRLLLFGVSLFIMGVIFLAQSRGAALGIAVALLILAMNAKPKLLWLVLLVVGGTALGLALTGSGNLVGELLFHDARGTAAGRLELWTRALYIMQDFPFTGLGLGTFEKVAPLLYPLFLNDPSEPLPHAHNMYLQMGVDYGIGGLVAFIGLVVTALGVGLRTIVKTRGTAQSLMTVGVVAAFAVLLTHGFLDAVVVSTKVNMVMWFLLALLTSLWHRAAFVAEE